jgi:hypothetical protein
MTLGSHQRCLGQSQDHITPKRFIDRLGPFDLDPCAAVIRPWDCAEVNWVVDGLIRIWFGLVWPIARAHRGGMVRANLAVRGWDPVPRGPDQVLQAGRKRATCQFRRTADPCGVW